MSAAVDVEQEIEALARSADPVAAVTRLVALGEDVLSDWVRAKGGEPTQDTREGFRLLALHRQGAKGVPSFNACRETCRELAYHYNLITSEPGHADTAQRLTMAAMVAKHLMLFVFGKLEVEGLGDFCCASRPLRANGG